MSALYSPPILSLAVSLANYPLSDDLPLRGEAHSRICGSTIVMALNSSQNGAITKIGMQVSACAIGQASAAIFAQSAVGKTLKDIEVSLSEMDRWLAQSGALPDWPRFDQLVPALPHTGRHEAMRLAWRAATAALSIKTADR